MVVVGFGEKRGFLGRGTQKPEGKMEGKWVGRREPHTRVAGTWPETGTAEQLKPSALSQPTFVSICECCNHSLGQGYSSMEEHLLGLCKALGSVPSTSDQ